ncbi:MAG: hypothetical protein HYZ54_01875 [Ignavibacteriae bacterium]|nr:hypothetical protein [Ignavibacteriota bacterium]
MKKIMRNLVICVPVLGILFSVSAFGQRTAQLRSILQNFKSYRYSNIFLFKLDDASVNAINPLLGTTEPKMNPAANRSKKKDEITELIDNGDDPLTEPDISKKLNNDDREYIKYYYSYKAWQDGLFKKAYIVTTRFRSEEPFEIIGLLTSTNDDSRARLDETIDPPKKVYLAGELRRIGSPDTTGIAKTLMEYLQRNISQDLSENITAEAQGLGEGYLIPKKVGDTKIVDEDDIQQYLRITEGQPQDYNSPNEITVGLFDLLRYRRYEPINSNLTSLATSIDSTQPIIYNKWLPKYGIELKQGFEEINYPSLWSERLTLSVMWQSYKLGLILPTSGAAPLSKDIFGVERKLTSAGMGANASFDFPMKIINQSGVFTLTSSYVFGDPKYNPIYTPETGNYLTYLPRFHIQGHYSFALNIDENHYFRFKLGGTFYTMEKWQRNFTPKPDSLGPIQPFQQDQNDAIASISGKIEYMTISNTVHWGSGLQYFDGTGLLDLWMQVPLTNSMHLRGEVKFFQTIFRDPKPWEKSNVFIPAILFIVNF